MQEKLRWAFSLYDVNGDGFITRQELRDVVCSVYALLGRRSSTDERALRDHVDRVFQRMDVNRDGVVTMDEFMEICSKVRSLLAIVLTLYDVQLVSKLYSVPCCIKLIMENPITSAHSFALFFY